MDLSFVSKTNVLKREVDETKQDTKKTGKNDILTVRKTKKDSLRFAWQVFACFDILLWDWLYFIYYQRSNYLFRAGEKTLKQS